MSNEQQKIDNLENALSRKGVRGKSKSGSNEFNSEGGLTDGDLRAIFGDSGIGYASVGRVVDDAYRKGFSVDNEPLMDQFNTLNGKEKFREAQMWGRMFGGAVIVMLISDGAEDLREPLNPNKVTSIEGLHVYDKTRVTIQEKYSDPLDPKFEQPKIFTIASESQTIIVHETRTIKFGGILTDYQTKQQRQGWDNSAMQPVYNQLLSLFSNIKSGEQIMDEFIVGILKMKNLADLSRTKEGQRIVHKRLDILDMTKSNENTVVTDGEEDYQKHISSISGFNELLEGNYSMVAGSCIPMMPQTILFGRSPGGQNATGDSDIRLWYDAVSSFQDNSVEPKLREFFDLISGGTEYEITFNNVYEETESEKSTTFKTKMEAGAVAVGAGIYSAEEIALADDTVEKLWVRDTSEPEDDAEEA